MVIEVKMVVTPDLSERVQEIVFANGGRWDSFNREIKIENTEQPYLFIDEYKNITYCNIKEESVFNNCEFEEISAYDFIASQGEQKKLPKYGEEVELSNDKKHWKKEKFSNYTPHYKRPYTTTYQNIFKYCRPIKQTKTITIEGNDIEISNECFENLKEQLLKD